MSSLDPTAPMVLEQGFNQSQIVAILGMYLAGMHGVDPKAFDVRFELKTDFKDDEGGIEFAAKLTMTEITS
jgi:hypothetical protein